MSARRTLRVFLVASVGALVLSARGSDSSIVDPKGSEAHRIAGVWWLMFGLATAVYIVVAGFILYASTRGRRRGAEPSRLSDNSFIWIGGVLVPVLILAVLAVATVTTTEALRKPAAGELRIDVTGELWWWRVHYPGSEIDGANEISLPAGQPVEIRLTSDNVIHSFWVPELAGKEDAIPGQVNSLRFTANEIGTYIGQCAEYCGIQHTHMTIRVHVLSPGDFGRWVARQQRTAGEPASDSIANGQVAFQREACAGCHAVNGTAANGTIGPNLSDVGARTTLGAGAIENNTENLEQWIRDAPHVKPGVLMPSFHALSDRDVADIAAYLENLEQDSMALVDKPKTALDHELEERWEDTPGIPGFFNSVDHKRIGLRYIYTAFVFFFVAGLLALVMRVQLAEPDSHVLDPDTYNQFFTMHGTAMIFLFNTPVLAGFGNYLIPLMLGSRDMAFPRLNAFSYWIFVLSAIFLFSSFVIGHPPDGGWFAYVPLTTKQYSPGINTDFWGLGVVFVGISTTVGAINFIVTIFKLRAPGMTLNRMPIFVWSMLVFSFMVIFAVPAVTVAAGLLEMDRLFGTTFYTVGSGGSALLYQHLFWFWGHPEVYILFVPATGMISMIIPVFSRQRLAGYIWVATALVVVAFISFGVWVHHMFATGIPTLALSFFSAASLIITIPSGVQFFAWIATMWKGVVRFSTPMLFAIGFLLIFLLGGITGVMVAVLPFDWQVTDSYFVVAHFHYVLNGAVVFPIFGALYFWLPKMTGKMLSERLGKISFWTMFIGFNVTFFPMHILGFLGMPRRVYTYESDLGWDGLNLVISIAAFFFAFGTLLTLWNFVWSQYRGAPAPDNPWDGDSLEWTTTSPPPEYNFALAPVVASRHPLWDEPQPLPVAAPGTDRATRALGVEGALEKEMPITEGLDALPQDTLGIPQPTYLPFVVAVGIALFFLGLLVEAAVVGVVGLAFGGVALMRWLWRTGEDLR